MTAPELEDAAARLLYSRFPAIPACVSLQGEVQVSSQLIDQAVALNRAIHEWRPLDFPLVWEGDQA